jgi:hypothetical protein
MATVRESVEVGVSAPVLYGLLCRIEEYHRLRSCLRRAVLVECRPAKLLRWRSLDGPVRAETLIIEAISQLRSQITVESTGPGDMSGRLRADLAHLKQHVEEAAPASPSRRAFNERRTEATGSNGLDAHLAGRPVAGSGANERKAPPAAVSYPTIRINR